jgi:hypothetical protein
MSGRCRTGVVALACSAALAAVGAGCTRESSTGDTVVPTGVPVPGTTAVVADPAPDATVEDARRDAAEQSEASPPDGARATLVIGDRTWTFPAIVCLSGADAEQVGAEFAFSGEADRAEIYGAASAAGHLITIHDITPGETKQGPAAVSLTTKEQSRFLRVDGSRVTARATFVPAAERSARGVVGTLDANCG